MGGTTKSRLPALIAALSAGTLLTLQDSSGNPSPWIERVALGEEKCFLVNGPELDLLAVLDVDQNPDAFEAGSVAVEKIGTSDCPDAVAGLQVSYSFETLKMPNQTFCFRDSRSDLVPQSAMVDARPNTNDGTSEPQTIEVNGQTITIPRPTQARPKTFAEITAENPSAVIAFCVAHRAIPPSDACSNGSTLLDSWTQIYFRDEERFDTTKQYPFSFPLSCNVLDENDTEEAQ